MIRQRIKPDENTETKNTVNAALWRLQRGFNQACGAGTQAILESGKTF